MTARLIGALAMLLGVVLAFPANVAQAQQAPAIDAKIEIVWPHDAAGNKAPVASAPLVNVEVYLFQRSTLNPVGCAFANTVTLRWAQNFRGYYDLPPYGGFGQLNPTGHAVPVYAPSEGVVGQRTTRTVNGKTFPVWVFNDVPVASTAVASAKPASYATYFVVDVNGADYRTNVWAHSADPRTYLPNQLTPQAGTAATPAAVDALFQVVSPHNTHGNPAAVAQAPLANVAVDLFQHPIPFWGMTQGTATVLTTDLRPRVWLLRALNDGYLERVKPADQTITYHGYAVWPRYEFDDIDVSAAQNPLNRYYFAVQVDGVAAHTTIWAHGADARTSFPRRDVPASGGAGCA
jgi:hypothetical protein